MKTLIIASVALVLAGCGASTQMTSATFATGDQFPLCVVVKQSTPFGVKLVAGFCATVESDLQAKAVELQKLYPAARVERVAALPVETVRK
jgi:hypothetical protein